MRMSLDGIASAPICQSIIDGLDAHVEECGSDRRMMRGVDGHRLGAYCVQWFDKSLVMSSEAWSEHSDVA
jgi:hypothetical protein